MKAMTLLILLFTLIKCQDKNSTHSQIDDWKLNKPQIINPKTLRSFTSGEVISAQSSLSFNNSSPSQKKGVTIKIEMSCDYKGESFEQNTFGSLKSEIPVYSLLPTEVYLLADEKIQLQCNLSTYLLNSVGSEVQYHFDSLQIEVTSDPYGLLTSGLKKSLYSKSELNQLNFDASTPNQTIRWECETFYHNQLTEAGRINLEAITSTPIYTKQNSKFNLKKPIQLCRLFYIEGENQVGKVSQIFKYLAYPFELKTQFIPSGSSSPYLESMTNENRAAYSAKTDIEIPFGKLSISNPYNVSIYVGLSENSLKNHLFSLAEKGKFQFIKNLTQLKVSSISDHIEPHPLQNHLYKLPPKQTISFSLNALAPRVSCFHEIAFQKEAAFQWHLRLVHPLAINIFENERDLHKVGLGQFIGKDYCVGPLFERKKAHFPQFNAPIFHYFPYERNPLDCPTQEGFIPENVPYCEPLRPI